MSESSYLDDPDLYMDHTTFPHLTGVKWDALNCLPAISGKAFVTSQMRLATPDGQRRIIYHFMASELAKSNRRALTPSRPSRSDVVKMEIPYYSGEGTNRLSLDQWFRGADIAITSRLFEVPQAESNLFLPQLTGKAKKWTLGKLVLDENALPTLEAIQDVFCLVSKPPQEEKNWCA